MIDDTIALEEDPRTRVRRRFQQRRCLVCGSRQLANRNQSYFCAIHLTTHRYCSACETLRTAAEHGKDSRCRACAAARALAGYHADPDRCLCRLALKRIAQRQRSRGDQIFESVRRRIALAELVAATPGMSWERRGRLVGADPTYLAETYRKQIRGDVRDPDAIDRARTHRRAS